MKRYIGNTGQIVYVDDAPVVPPQRGTISGSSQPVGRMRANPLDGLNQPVGGIIRSNPLGGLSLPFGLEIADIAVLLLFFFLYQESGDEEFLILLACFAICILGKQ